MFPGFATSGLHYYTMITDRQKLTTKLTLYGMSSFHYRFSLLSRPNKVGLKCPYIHPSTKSFFNVHEIYNLGRGR